MADREHLEILKRGSSEWNRWRLDNLDATVDLSGANLIGVNLSGADLRRAHFVKADLSGANLGGASLKEANLSSANLYKANLAMAKCRGANLREANLNNAELDNSNLIDVNFTGAGLREANLPEASAHRANLTQADLSKANLHNTNFSQANLTQADLSDVDLGAANLIKANLAGAHLINTNLVGADLTGANLAFAILGGTVFGDTALDTVEGLEECQHVSASFIDYHTLARNAGLPQTFLRGVGLPDHFIDYLPSLVGKLFEFYSCFISYSVKDQEFAERLHADLQNNGVRCWFAPKDIKAGEKVHEQIDHAIRLYERLLLVVSQNSINSEWVKTEIAKARKKELNEKRKVLFPIRLIAFEEIRDWECFDSDTGKDSARELREYFIPDFSSWKDSDAYKNAFERLLCNLKAKPQPKVP